MDERERRTRRDQLREIIATHGMKRGDFTLASGARSKYFFQGKLATLSPAGARLTGEVVFECLRGRGIEAVGGKALGANPIVTAVSLISELRGERMPGFIVRGSQKDHGLEELIAESYADDGKPLISKGRRVAIVDDVATSGKSCMDAVRAVVEKGCEVVTVLVLVDRNQGAADTFRAAGLNFEALFAADSDGMLSDWLPPSVLA